MQRAFRLTALAVLLLAACEPSPPPVTVWPASVTPDRLSDWHVVHSDGDRLTLNDGVIPYDLNVPLFSDYALKLRTVWMPDGMAAEYRDDREFDFPVGTILSKTFHYRYGDSGIQKLDAEATLEPDGSLNLETHRIVETRLLIRDEEGWRALPYVWNDKQTEAFLEVAGTEFDFSFTQGSEPGSDPGLLATFTYIVPDMNQCEACHVPDFSTKEVRPLGPKAHQLHREFDYIGGPKNQLLFWQESGRLVGLTELPPAMMRWQDRNNADPDEMARTYLDTNCAHCHNPDGPADTSGLDLSLGASLNRTAGICKPPVAVGRGSGNRPYDIFPGKPEQSILLYRMKHDDPAIMMPELGRAMSHEEAVVLIRDWIAALPGDC